jgi:hypothetical protein
MEANMATSNSTQHFHSFAAFYPFYLSEHQNRTCRRLHVVGSSLILLILASVIISGHLVWLWTLPIVGYGFAWLGHFAFEKNRPATFKNPLYSFAADWVMFKDVLLGRIPF